MKTEHLEQIKAAVEAVRKKGTINHFYFVACGGSQAFMMPAQYLLDRELDIPSSVYSSNEFVYRAPKALGKDSVVITCSHSGTTPETVRATEIAREKGGLTIALSFKIGSPLWEAAEYPCHYDWGKDADDTDKNKGVLYSILFGILDALNPCEKYKAGIAAVDQLGIAIEKAKAQYSEKTAAWAKKYKRETLIYTMASGSSYGEAYSFAICLLMEMQWIHSSCIHSGEYFHGPFEITDFDVPFVIIKSRGATRYLDERAFNFCTKYSNEVMLVDENDFDMSGIDESVQEYFASLITGAVLRTFADGLAYERGHDLSVRRYMWRMEY